MKCGRLRPLSKRRDQRNGGPSPRCRASAKWGREMSQKKVSPWLQGVVETLAGAEVLRRSNIPNRNRLAVILIDSAFETACRAFLRHKVKIKSQDNHRHRENLMSTVKTKLSHIEKYIWDDINYYYQDVRCDFYHQSASKTIADDALLDYIDTVRFVIDKAFDVDTSALVKIELVKVGYIDFMPPGPCT